MKGVFTTQSQRLVVRSTFSAELLALTGATDHAFLYLVTFEELIHGPVKPSRLLKMREEGGFKTKLVIMIDAKSVYHSIKNSSGKYPAEKSLLGHIHWIKELKSTGIISALLWVDTRDMRADGMTKGSCDRRALLEAMSGRCSLAHPFESF